MNIISKYQYITPEGMTFPEGITEQSHANECDVNRIMAKYQQTGVCDHIKKYAPVYGDFEATDYQEALELVASGEEMFSELPSKARAYFENSPTTFIQYMNENPNPRVLAELGLALRREDEPQAKGPACPPPQNAGAVTPPVEEPSITEGESA